MDARPDLDVTLTLHTDRVTYWMTLDVPLYERPQDAAAVFFARPAETYTLAPEDFPTVFAGMSGYQPWLTPSDLSKVVKGWPVHNHRYPSGAVCLYYPRSPAHQRWTADKGLVVLVNMISRHLWAERMVMLGRPWPLEEEAHGFPEDRRGTAA